jgi:Enoyl-(Acyl carrier protein) reductase
MCAAALNQLTKNLACDWAKHGIRVNAVAPWYTATPLANQVLQDKEYEAAVLARTPLGRVAQPEEVAGMLACVSVIFTHCMSPVLQWYVFCFCIVQRAYSNVSCSIPSSNPNRSSEMQRTNKIECI